MSTSRRIDLVLSNDRHHTAMMRPLAMGLADKPEYHCRIISLCEFRGIPSPQAAFAYPGVEFVRVLPFRFRSNKTGGQSANPTVQEGRTWARRVSWRVLLERPLAKVWEANPDLVILPNDAAFPYDGIVTQLKACDIPFLLLQEGIRFPLPHGSKEKTYGRGGAAALAAWGAASAAYFEQAGAPRERIFLTGSPRFDAIAQMDWNAERDTQKRDSRFGKTNLLLLTNPIDDQGFCTTQGKYELVRRIFQELAPLFQDPDFRLIVKLHGREDAAAYERLKSDLAYASQVHISDAFPLYPLFTLADAALIFASTVGLEALLFDVPLGVVEIPGHGFVYDYVSGGGACGVTLTEPLAPQVTMLMAQRGMARPGARAYVAHNLAHRENATGQIVQLIDRLVRDEASG